MVQKIIKCPKCGQSIRVNIPDNAVGTASVNCPNPQCGALLKFKLSPNPAADVAMPSLYVDGKEFPLKLGRNVVGRHPQSDCTNIVITPSDAYMSRQHASIVVKKEGNEMKCILETLKTINPLLLNGKRVEEGVALALKLGDVMTMGHTKVLLQKANCSVAAMQLGQ